MITILEVPQGYYRNLAGRPLEEITATIAKMDEDFVNRNPSCKPYHRPTFNVREVPDGRTAPWGYEWYAVGEDQRLRMHSAQYDSSG